MGTYYITVCHELKEYIDPFYVGNGGCKAGALIFGDINKLVLFQLTFKYWSSCSVVSDNDMYFETILEEYNNITKKVIDMFNSYYVEHYIEYQSRDGL